MSQQELNSFLSVIAQKLAGEASNHRYVQPRFSGYDHFSSQPAFFAQVVKAASASALDRIDSLAGNAHWFLVMLATSLVLADQLPASEDDVVRALYLQRQLAIRASGESIVGRVGAGKFSALTESEFVDACARGLIVVDNTNPEGDQLYVNPVLVTI
jgi:hypothetical protein